MGEKNYKIAFVCTNCGRDVNIKIPYGTPSNGFKSICPKCGIKLTLGKWEKYSG